MISSLAEESQRGILRNSTQVAVVSESGSVQFGRGMAEAYAEAYSAAL